MGRIFRINKKGESKPITPDVDWTSSPATTYNHGYVNDIQDATTSQSEITSIPSPFARIELVKEAFGKIIPVPLNTLNEDKVKEYLNGNTIYHKMVSDALDIAQIFFIYPSKQDEVEIIVWDKDSELKKLDNSTEDAHKIVGRTLRVFFDQDAAGNDPYNFGKMQKMYILRYKGKGCKPMHIIGATSPATLFFATANDEQNISKQLCFGTDFALDPIYCPLDQRDPEFVKYLFTFRYSYPNFSKDFPEVTQYLDAIYFVLDDELKQEIRSIQAECQNTSEGTSYIAKNYDNLIVNINPTTSLNVEINGVSYHSKKANTNQKSDFVIDAKKEVSILPLVLPVVNTPGYAKLWYYSSVFGTGFRIPFDDKSPLHERKLPGIKNKYPYLTISDFLEDKIVKLPSAINTLDYFDGNCTSNRGQKNGYLLPLTDTFFDYFTSDYLQGNAPSGKKAIEVQELAAGVQVILRIPIKSQNDSIKEIEYKRIYNCDVSADKEKNIGAIVVPDEDLAIGVMPPVRFKDEKDAYYRIVLLADFNVIEDCSCKCYGNESGEFTPAYVKRNVDIHDDLSAKVYLLDRKAFDFARITLTSNNGKERKGSGIIIPKFRKRSGSDSFTFAIDLGTSNTHIEYTIGDGHKSQKPFEFNYEQPQMSLLFATDSAAVMDHIRAEFIPESMGKDEACHFPMRTVLCIDKVNSGHDGTGDGGYEPFGNASPAFMYNKKIVGSKYNNYVPNLKWSKSNDLKNTERLKCYIESLFMMIRAKVVQEGGNLNSTKIKWFYPISMPTHRKALFEQLWINAHKKYFNPDEQPIAISESVAPYKFFQETRPDVTNIVTIDVGGGTTDIVVADSKGVKCISSMRFAANSIFGNELVNVEEGPLNGLIRQWKKKGIIETFKGTGLNDLRSIFENMTTNDHGNSAEVASFLFSLSEDKTIKAKSMVDKVNFHNDLAGDTSQKIVFFIFFTSIMYYLAHLMKAMHLDIPKNIAFSGNGSKVVSILSASTTSLERLTAYIFKFIYGSDDDTSIKIINSSNPKEATCRGGLFLENEPEGINEKKNILYNVSKEILCTTEKYSDQKTLIESTVEDVNNYFDFLTSTLTNIPRFSLNAEFGIKNESLDLAKQCFKEDLATYVEKGLHIKLDSGDVNKDDVLEEPFFFYPIIGVMNDLSNRICDNE